MAPSFPDSLRTRLLALHANSALTAGELAELKDHGLLDDSTGGPSALARCLMDLLVCKEWQQADEFTALMSQVVPDTFAGSVLELGCSTGQKLRTLGRSMTAKCVGVDVDAKAPALGWQLASREQKPIHFYCCSAHSLPFPSESFDLIICRNALTYMHHRTALREMGRVLRPNGLLFVRFENIWFDLQRLIPPKGPKSLLALGRNFLLGVVLAALGWQPSPGTRLWGWRAFATLRQLKRMLRHSNCQITRVEEAWNCPRFLGLSTQTSLLASKSAQSQSGR